MKCGVDIALTGYPHHVICRVFQNNPDSVPRFCTQIKDDKEGHKLTVRLHEALKNED